MDFVCGEAAINFKEYIVISDLHIGFEEELEEKGYTVPDQTDNVISRLKKLSKIKNKLIILGDVKHAIILKNKSRLLYFFSKINDLFKEIIIVKGNHDGSIENTAIRFSNIRIVNELLIGSDLFIHGHRYASDEVMKKAKRLFIGHFHSAHTVKDYLGIVNTTKTWVFYTFNNEDYNKKYKTHIGKVVGFPCFNLFFDGSGEKNGPYANYLVRSDVLTLDLVKLA